VIGRGCAFCHGALGGKDLGVLCPTCGKVQPPPPTAFDALGLSPSFALDAVDLHRRFLALQRLVHPDRLLPDAERHNADGRACSSVALQGWSAAVNRSFQQLKDPVSRAKLLIALKDPAFNEDTDLALEDEAFLQQVLEQRELIESGELTAEAARTDLLPVLSAQSDNLQKELHLALDEHGDIDRAKHALCKLIYLRNLLEAIEESTG
jgi:molecular chaperone HscB